MMLNGPKGLPVAGHRSKSSARADGGRPLACSRRARLRDERATMRRSLLGTTGQPTDEFQLAVIAHCLPSLAQLDDHQMLPAWLDGRVPLEGAHSQVVARGRPARRHVEALIGPRCDLLQLPSGQGDQRCCTGAIAGRPSYGDALAVGVPDGVEVFAGVESL